MHAKIKKVSFQIFSSIVFHFLVPCRELARAQQAVTEVAEQFAHLNREKKMRPWPAESEGMSVSEKLVSCELLARPLRS
jgi:hypothetical protein